MKVLFSAYKMEPAGLRPRLLTPAIELGDTLWWKRPGRGVIWLHLIWWDYAIGIGLDIGARPGKSEGL